MISLAFDNGDGAMVYSFPVSSLHAHKDGKSPCPRKAHALISCHEIPSAGYFRLWQPAKAGSGRERKKGAKGSLWLEDSGLVVCLFLFFQFVGKVGLHHLED